jgi:tyrosine-protein phosphatase SIW14
MKRIRASIVSLLLVGSLSIPALAQPGHSVELSTIRIANFGNVSPGYYRGAQPKGEDFADLAAIGIKTVIDLQKDGDPGEQSAVEGHGMQFLRIPMTTRVAPTNEQIARFLATVNDPAKQPVYVHCAGGRHRTGVMTAVYRMSNERWEAAKAFAEMKKYDFGKDYLHPEFKRFVYGFHPAPAQPPVPVVALATATGAD